MNSKSLVGWSVFWGIVVIGAWVAWWFVPMRFDDCITTEQQGQIGDKFGALNTLFTGVAFIGLAYSILSERQAREGAIERERQSREEANMQERQAREQGEKAHARQVELAADTARMQALPVLIALQRDRIKGLAADLCPGWEERHLFSHWVDSTAVALRRNSSEYSDYLSQLERTPTDGTLIGFMDRHGGTEGLKNKITRISFVLPELDRLKLYLTEFPALYEKMREKETPVSAG